MRVTKTIREFIEREVSLRIASKYEADEKEAKRQNDAIDKFREDCADAAKKAFNAYFDAHFHEIADFASDERQKSYINFYSNNSVVIRDRIYTNSVHGWSNRKRAEAKKLVDEIIVEMELGGTKAELMELLNKIGQ